MSVLEIEQRSRINKLIKLNRDLTRQLNKLKFEVTFMSMTQKLIDGRAEFIKNNNKGPDKVSLNFDEGFKLLEEIRDMTKDKEPYDVMTRVLLSRDEEGLIDVFKRSTIFGMNIKIERIVS